MRKITFTLVLALTASLYIGYYREAGEFKTYNHIFIKTSPTLQIKFENIFANLRDDKELSELTHQERQIVMDYCKYRLGIETQLTTQGELERCKEL